MGGEEAVEFCVEGELRLRGLSLVFFAACDWTSCEVPTSKGWRTLEGPTNVGPPITVGGLGRAVLLVLADAVVFAAKPSAVGVVHIVPVYKGQSVMSRLVYEGQTRRELFFILKKHQIFGR